MLLAYWEGRSLCADSLRQSTCSKRKNETLTCSGAGHCLRGLLLAKDGHFESQRSLWKLLSLALSQFCFRTLKVTQLLNVALGVLVIPVSSSGFAPLDEILAKPRLLAGSLLNMYGHSLALAFNDVPPQRAPELLGRMYLENGRKNAKRRMFFHAGPVPPGCGEWAC